MLAVKRDSFDAYRTSSQAVNPVKKTANDISTDEFKPLSLSQSVKKIVQPQTQKRLGWENMNIYGGNY